MYTVIVKFHPNSKFLEKILNYVLYMFAGSVNVSLYKELNSVLQKINKETRENQFVKDGIFPVINTVR
jgi:hypothetical protein